MCFWLAMTYDLFISYASEDQEGFVLPLVARLTELGVKVWFAPAVLKPGDSIARQIDNGLSECKFAAVVLSKAFMSKPWTEYELRGLINGMIEKRTVILPIWHNVSKNEVLKFSPSIADQYALITLRAGTDEIAFKITEVVRPDIYQNLLRLALWHKLKREGERLRVSPKSLKLGPIRHAKLPDPLLVRIKIVHHILSEILATPLDKDIDNFRRDAHPWEEILVWERIAAAYLDATRGKELNLHTRTEILRVLLTPSLGYEIQDIVMHVEHLSYDEVIEILTIYTRVVPQIADSARENSQSEIRSPDTNTGQQAGGPD